MSILLYPRLDLLTAIRVHEEIQSCSIEELARESLTDHKNAIYTQTGGINVKSEQLQEIADNIRTIAEQYGYPSVIDRKSQAKFDANVSAWLYIHVDINYGEALRKDVWSFMSLVLLPDIAKWRFPEFHIRRLTGGVRNVLQRLWLRAHLFDLGKSKKNRWLLLHLLTEDAMVAIVERPSISANRVLARSIGLSWAKMAATIGSQKMEKINREAMKYLRMQIPLICLDALSDKEIINIVIACYKKAENSIE